MARHLWLVGMMGSGKSSAGRLFAERLDSRFVDTDDVLTGRMGCSIAEFWGSRGEEAFRDMEAAVVAELESANDRVIATGGGVVLRKASVDAMRRSGLVIWLQASAETLARRVSANHRRPLLQGQDESATLAELLDARRSSYAAAAHGSVATDDLALETVVERIEELWNAY